MPNNSFVKSVSVLAGGTAAGQLIVIAASPVLTRLYSPEDFGVLAIYIGILGISGVVASLRYQLAIPLPESDEKALNVAVLSLLILTILTAIIVIIVGVFGSNLVTILNTPNLEPYLWLLPVGFALVGLHQIFQYWALRAKLFAIIAKTKLVQSGSVASIQILGAGLGPLALLSGRALGEAIANFMFLKGAKSSIPALGGNVNLKLLFSAAKNYRQFPLFSSWAGLLNASGSQIPPLVFAALFGPAAAGGYMLAQRVINIPLSVIGTAVSDAFLPSSIAALRENRLGVQVIRLFSALASLMFPSAVLLFFVAPDLFAILFGSDWRIAGEIVRWLAPMLAIQFLVNPVSRIFVTIERQDLALLFQVCLFGLRVGSLIFASVFDLTLLGAVKAFSLASIVGYFLYLVAICRISGVTLFGLLKVIKITLIFVILTFTLCLLTYFFLEGEGMALLVSMILGGMLVVGNLIFFLRVIRSS